MKNKKFEQLKFLYLFIFILSTILIIPTHIFPQPYLMPFRFPHYLETMGPFWGIRWPMSFEIYHYVIYALIVIGSLNILGIFFYPKLNKIASVSSLCGIFLFSLMILFFFFIFINVNLSTAIIYGFYSVVLLFADVLTFEILINKRKDA